jgi:hypothetical protein
METLEKVALGLVVLSNLVTVVLVCIKQGPAKRARRRDELAAMAVDYAEQMGGDKSQRLAHAIGAAQRIDAADNGKRDYSDAELRIAIEAALARR